MSVPLPKPHTAVCAADGFTDHTHPDPDHDGCDFETYLATDFPNPIEAQFGPWRFYWMAEGGGYWNGSHDPGAPPVDG